VSALAFTTTFFTLDWAHTTNRQNQTTLQTVYKGHELIKLYHCLQWNTLAIRSCIPQ